MRFTTDNFEMPDLDADGLRSEPFDHAAWDALFDIADFDEFSVRVPETLPTAAEVLKQIECAPLSGLLFARQVAEGAEPAEQSS